MPTPTRGHNDVRSSRLNAPPVGCTVWPRNAGLFTGNGQARFVSNGSYVCFHLIVRGAGTVRTESRTQLVEAGDMFSLMRGRILEYWEEPEAPWQMYWVDISGDDDMALAEACGFSTETPWFRPTASDRVQRCFQNLHEAMDVHAAAGAHHLTALLLSIVDACQPAHAATSDESRRGSRDLVAQATSLMDAQLHTGIDVCGLARALGVDRTTLFRAFHDVTGNGPAARLRDVRLEHAKGLLAGTSRPVATVARMLGFRGEKYFLRWFRKHTGVTPTQWRGGAGPEKE